MKDKREQALSPQDFRALWDAKPVLRAVYRDYYQRICGWVRGHPTVEIGAGGANLKETLPGLIASDVVRSPWLDLTLDAQAMPFASGSVGTFVGIDVLHHIEHPREFLAEAERTLKPGGRVAFIEPAITPVSWVAFKLGHPEPVVLDVDPLASGPATTGRHPMDSNQALPTLLVGRDRERLEREFPRLRVAHRERLSLFAYPLSGGFRSWCLLPEALVQPVLRAERHLDPVLGSVMGFRLLLVLERT